MAESTSKRPRSPSPSANQPSGTKRAKEEPATKAGDQDRKDMANAESPLEDALADPSPRAENEKQSPTGPPPKPTTATTEMAAANFAQTEAGAEGGAEGDNGDTSPQIALRCLIVTTDASIIIGKQGKHINEIRDKSGAKLTISESIQGNPERVMTVQGQLDAVSKAFGLVVRRINEEPFDQPSLPGSRAWQIRFIIPNSRMGSVIGKAGAKIKEIQEASGAKLTAGEAMLPNSTERVLSVSGVADAVHIAVYYVGTILVEHSDRHQQNVPYRPGPGGSGPAGQGARGGVPGGAVPFNAGYGGNPMLGGGNPMGGMPGGVMPTPFVAGGAAGGLPPGSQTQQIFIPNDLVGCIIGKGGQKINEIRQMSQSHIKIMEPSAGLAAGGSGQERLVTITGPPQNIQIAVSLLYQRLEQEKVRMAQGGSA